MAYRAKVERAKHREWRGPIAASICLICGCSKSPAAGYAVAPPSTPAAANVRRPDALPKLEASVESIGEGAKGLDQHNLSRVLRQLAAGMRPVSHATALRLSDLAQRLDRSPAESLTHPRLLKEGLSVLLDGLLAVRVSSAGQARYRRALQAFDRARAAVAELSPFSEQIPGIRVALRAGTDAVFLARGQAPPFDEAAALSLREPSVGTFQAELEQANVSVSELASADWMSSREATARALAAFADLVEAADGGKRAREVHDVRFQAERLSLSETRHFGQAKWVKVGLTKTLDAWEELDGAANLDPIWSRTARATVEALDERSDLSFQRGAIQDAFRSVLAAFVAASEPPPQCPDDGRSARARVATPAPTSD